MSSSVTRHRMGAIILLAGAAGGLGVAIYNYITPLTGVTGTIGAALVIFTTAIMAISAIILPNVTSRPLRNTLRVLLLLDILGTALAAFFLLEFWLLVAMLVALVGSVVDMFQPSTSTRAGAYA